MVYIKFDNILISFDFLIHFTKLLDNTTETSKMVCDFQNVSQASPMNFSIITVFSHSAIDSDLIN